LKNETVRLGDTFIEWRREWKIALVESGIGTVQSSSR
jgi:hypothetical protein